MDGLQTNKHMDGSIDGLQMDVQMDGLLKMEGITYEWRDNGWTDGRIDGFQTTGYRWKYGWIGYR